MARSPLRAWFHRRPLRWRLSILFAVTAASTVLAFGVFAYLQVRASTLAAVHAELRSALVQIKTITELGSMTQVQQLHKVAAAPAVVEALRRPRERVSPEALAALQELQGAAGGSIAVELVDRDGSARHAIAADESFENHPPFDLPHGGGIGPMYERNGALFFQSGIAAGTARDTLGGVRVIRRLGNGSANRRIAKNLLGDEAVLLVGNSSGDLWSESGPVRYEFEPGQPVRHERDGTAWISLAMPVAGTPWLYAIAIPERVALAPARALLTPFLVSGVVIALAFAFVGMRVSRHITTPLADLTAATEAIARGDRDVHLVFTDREDEIGRLARAFGTMAASVMAVQHRLEEQVGERTGELTAAIERLRQVDEELKRNERFAALGRLSGSVSHELRNPLGVMNMVVYMIEGLPDASPKLKEYARLLQEQIRLSERIINDLLDNARSGVPVKTMVEVPRLLDDIVAHAGIPRSIRVERRDVPPLPPVIIDRDHVTQIVWNLVTNAVQAMRGTSEPCTLGVCAQWRDGRLRIEVTDSGPGVAAADVERIFEPMFTTKPDGVGLGLSISRAFARASGGDLFVMYSGRPGGCFVLELAAPEAAAAS